jgi:hypothetical protein
MRKEVVVAYSEVRFRGKENHRNFQPGHPVSRPKFKPVPYRTGSGSSERSTMTFCAFNIQFPGHIQSDDPKT